MNIDAHPWWKKTVVYQIYPRSYMDTTGTGTGDLKGIISKLDYLNDLGVETIWISPFYPSPTYRPYREHDCGYDISNYRDVNPEYGNMDDFDALLKGLHDRGMKLVMDMVMNHTSTDHEWFKESRSSKDNPKRDWYIWRDGKKPNGAKKPNDWRAMPMGSAWHYDETTDQWYYAEFLPFQPDLNYRNPEVQEEMLNTVRYWLKKGVDGFRLDIFNALFEEDTTKNMPKCASIVSENLDILFKSSKYQLNHPDTLEFAKTLRSVLDEFPDKFLVGEVAASLPVLQSYLGDKVGDRNNGLNLIFLFQALNVPLKANKMKKLIKTSEKWFDEPHFPTIVFGNHDQFRRISKFGGDLEKAKLNAAFQLTVRGVPFIYYGEEIGIENGNLPCKTSKDAVTHHIHQWVPYFILDLVPKFHFAPNRDDCRTPMQWDATNENAGFSANGVETWLPVHKDYKERNVHTQLADENSLLNCYKRFIAARKIHPALQSGSFTLIEDASIPKTVLAFNREASSEKGPIKHEKLFILCNCSKNPVSLANPLPKGELIVSTHLENIDLDEQILTLLPWQVIVLK